MARDVFSPKTDIIFKKMFTENMDMLSNFLSEMLDIPENDISEIKITNTEMPPETLSGKFSRLDLNMTVDDRLVNVEVQVKNDVNFRDRALLYWSKLYSSGIKRGEDYNDLKQTITINIINFNMFDDGLFHHRVMPMVMETKEIFSDKQLIHFAELRKLSKEIDPKNRLQLWLQFINAESEEVFKMIEQTNIPIMQKAVRVIYDMSEDTAIREAARLREKALYDETSAINAAKREGMYEERAKLTAKLKARGMSEADIKSFFDE